MPSLRDRLLDADLRLFRKISGWRSTSFRRLRPASATPAERVMVGLSWGANHSKLWFVIGGGLFAAGGRSGKRAAVRGVASIGATSAIVNFALKPFVKRRRPPVKGVPAARRVTRQPTTTSFPSGHAASAFAFATGVGLEKPVVGAALAPVAAAVAYSRTFIGVHYPTDVAAGALLGTGVALAGRKLWPAHASDAPEAAAAPPTRRRLEPNEDGEGVVMIVNPQSGSGADPARPDIDDLRRLFPKAKLIELTEEDDPGEVARRAAEEAEIVGASGGDGTIAAAAQAAFDSGKPLLLTPGGTMNHLAHDLGIREASDAHDALSRGEAVEIDVASLDGQLFTNNASFGAHTQMVDERRSLEDRVGRWPAQILAAIKTLSSAEPVEVKINGERRPVWMAFIGNGSYHEQGIAPGWRRSLGDGRLDVRMIDAQGHGSRFRALLGMLAAGPTGSQSIHTEKLPEIEIEPTNGELRLSRDGETFDASGTVKVEAHPRGLVVFAPARERSDD